MNIRHLISCVLKGVTLGAVLFAGPANAQPSGDDRLSLAGIVFNQCFPFVETGATPFQDVPTGPPPSYLTASEGDDGGSVSLVSGRYLAIWTNAWLDKDGVRNCSVMDLSDHPVQSFLSRGTVDAVSVLDMQRSDMARFAKEMEDAGFVPAMAFYAESWLSEGHAIWKKTISDSSGEPVVAEVEISVSFDKTSDLVKFSVLKVGYSSFLRP